MLVAVWDSCPSSAPFFEVHPGSSEKLIWQFPLDPVVQDPAISFVGDLPGSYVSLLPVLQPSCWSCGKSGEVAPLCLPRVWAEPDRAVPVGTLLGGAECPQRLVVPGPVVLERFRSYLWVGSQIRRGLLGRQGLA